MIKDFPSSKHIHVLNDHKAEESYEGEMTDYLPEIEWAPLQEPKKTNKSYTVEEIRKKHSSAYKPWTQELDDELTIMFCEGLHVKDMAKHFGRSKGSIMARIIKLELFEKYGF